MKLTRDIDMSELSDALDYVKSHSNLAEDIDIIQSLYFEPEINECKLWLLCTGALEDR